MHHLSIPARNALCNDTKSPETAPEAAPARARPMTVGGNRRGRTTVLRMTARLLPALVVLYSLIAGVAADDAERIQPWKENPRYWQYQGKPVLLLGGSQDDNLFQLPNLAEHLDEMQRVGANFIRNTMSARQDGGFEVHEFYQREDGKYDLDRWNEEYWQRLENMLRWTHQRNIIVQIEVWDRFDYSREHWLTSPWNPANNVNYTFEQTGLAAEYPEHPSSNKQPFFDAVAGMPNYDPKLDLVHEYQKRRVEKLLSYSLEYPHVLYCMNNETSASPRWGQYWIQFIRDRAARRGVEVFCTDMFDDAYMAERARHTQVLFEHPEIYSFLDISQVNSRNFDQLHWDRLQWLLEQAARHPRPAGHVKIYGSGYKSFGTGGPEDGVERFWRNIIGGSATSRFHRPDSGNGLNDLAQASIRAARLVEQRVRFWEVSPHMELLSQREADEAYLAAAPGEKYVVYFTDGGQVDVDLRQAPGEFTVTWISISMGIEVQSGRQGSSIRPWPRQVRGGGTVTLTAPYQGPWVVTLVKTK
ncbi:MAG: hypothetical protein KatS3mg111_3194 [Pirellulaceae bacterium]|nr:MAG: hypothetical protein KatS3mg111_3194 [Pirellulaceae bacterium]